MSRGTQVLEVRSRREERAFCELPYRLYAHDPLWTPPLRLGERARWRVRHNDSLRGRRLARFVAWRGGCAVGRIAAVFDPCFAQRWAPGAGLFGFFECEDDRGTSRRLLSAAEASLREWGATRVMGPVNLTSHDEVGFLTSGFEHSASVLTPYNPPFYPELAADAGYRPSHDYVAYEWSEACVASPAIERLARSAGHGVRIRAVRASDWHAEVRRLHELYERCFADLWGFVGMRTAEFVQRAEQFRAFYRPELILIAETRERPVAFAVLLPDVNEALPAAQGRLLPLGWWRLRRALRRIRSGRFILLGVEPGFRGRGLAARLALEMGHAVRRTGLRRVEVSMVLAGNERMHRVIAAFGCRESRRFRLYERVLVA